ncbi:MAG: type IV pilin [Thaumarchaeota archaeon]|nr:type IV pilin [Nitrososphaerota archaeon]
MTTKIYLKKARAISPIIATIILIVITVVAGGFIYAYVSGMLHSGTTSQQASIQSYALIPGSGDNATLTVTVQDSGTVAITSINISSLGTISTTTFNSGINPFLRSIAPDSTMSNSTSITGTFLAGDTYTATFVVTYANGATQDITEGLVASTY